MGRLKVIYSYKCEQCGLEFSKSGATKRRNGNHVFCGKPCSYAWKSEHQKGRKFNDALPHYSGQRHYNWKGGGITSQGYRLITIGPGKAVLEHRYVLEQHLGRKLLSNEHVHHVNGIKTDNRIENLRVLDIREHGRLHSNEYWQNAA